MGIFFTAEPTGPYETVGQFKISPSPCVARLPSEDDAGGRQIGQLDGFAVWAGDRVIRFFCRKEDAHSFAVNLDVHLTAQARGPAVFTRFEGSTHMEHGLGATKQEIEWSVRNQRIYSGPDPVIIQWRDFAIGGDESGPFKDVEAAEHFLSALLRAYASDLAQEPGNPNPGLAATNGYGAGQP